MLDILYVLFIAPIDSLLAGLFFVAESLTKSRLLQIILLSLFVSILLVPIYNLFDYWQNKDRTIEKKMQPKLEMLKRTFKGQERFAYIKTVYRQYHYNPIYGVRNSLGFILQIPFFIGAYQFLSHNPDLAGISSGFLKNLSAPDGLISIGNFKINLLPILMTVINLWSGLVYSKGLMRKDKIQVIVIALVFLLLLYNSASALVLYWTFNNVFSLIKNLIHRYRSPHQKVTSFIHKQRLLPYLAGALFLTIAFFYFPSQLVASDPSVFAIGTRQLAVYEIFYSALVIGLYSLYVARYFLIKISKILDGATFVLAIFALLTASYNIFDTGMIDHFLIANLNTRLGPLAYRVMVDIGIVLLILVAYRFLSDRIKRVVTGISLAVFLTFSVVTIAGVDEGIDPNVEMSDGKYPAYIDEITTFSTNHKNIFVLMLDGFTNPLIRDIVEMDPVLKADLEGFTWYSNTLSTGDNTFLGGPAIHGGLGFSPYEVNQQGGLKNGILEGINRAYLPLMNALTKADYEIDLINVQYTDCAAVQALAPGVTICTEIDRANADLNTLFFETHADRLPYSITEAVAPINEAIYLPSIGIFYTTFYSLRELIYNNGKWLTPGKEHNIGVGWYSSYAFLTSYFDLVNFKETEQPVFKYLNNNYTHAPWGADSASCHFGNWDSYADDAQHAVNKNHYYTTYCSMKEVQRFIQQLKAHDAWDNSMIVLVSDHSFKGDMKLAEIFSENGEIDFMKYPGNPSSLLLVKDFNSTGPFQESTIFMSQADVPSIVCHELGGCEGIAQDPRENPDPKRKLIHTMGGWHPDRHPKDHYKFDSVWEVTGDMYIRENWQKIE